jgi:hypothetical protein
MDCTHTNQLRWYPFLVRKEADENTPQYKILRECYSADELSRKVVIAMETRFDGKRNYAVLDSHIDLYKYIRMSEQGDRLFHEIVPSESLQKPRFDIDMEREEYEADLNAKEFPSIQEFCHFVKDRVIDAILSVLSRDGIYLNINKNIIVCSSHGEDKASYHIIVTGYTHGSKDEAKAFYEEVMKEIEDKEIVGKYIDPQVYSKNQPFRLLWCHKIGKNRVKVLEEEFLYNGEVYKHEWPCKSKSDDHLNVMMLEASMLTFASGSDMLPYYESASKRQWDNNLVLTDDESQKAFALLRDEWVKRASADEISMPFRVNHVKGGLIALTRERPSLCQVCNVIHEIVDPYMFVIKGNVYFNCRRSEKYLGRKTNQFIGSIPYSEVQTSTLAAMFPEDTQSDDAWDMIAKLAPPTTPVPTTLRSPHCASVPVPTTLRSPHCASVPVPTTPAPHHVEVRSPSAALPFPTQSIPLVDPAVFTTGGYGLNIPQRTLAEKASDLSRAPMPKPYRSKGMINKYADKKVTTMWSSDTTSKKNSSFM